MRSAAAPSQSITVRRRAAFESDVKISGTRQGRHRNRRVQRTIAASAAKPKDVTDERGRLTIRRSLNNRHERRVGGQMPARVGAPSRKAGQANGGNGVPVVTQVLLKRLVRYGVKKNFGAKSKVVSASNDRSMKSSVGTHQRGVRCQFPVRPVPGRVVLCRPTKSCAVQQRVDAELLLSRSDMVVSGPSPSSGRCRPRPCVSPPAVVATGDVTFRRWSSVSGHAHYHPARAGRGRNSHHQYWRRVLVNQAMRSRACLWASCRSNGAGSGVPKCA